MVSTCWLLPSSSGSVTMRMRYLHKAGTFHNPVQASATWSSLRRALPAAGAVTLQAIVRGALCAQKYTIATASTPISDEAESLATDHQSDHVPFPLLATPLDQDPQLHVGSRYVIALDDVDLPDSFQRASHCLGGQGLRATLALSYFVGMICPGLHSNLLVLELYGKPSRGRPRQAPFCGSAIRSAIQPVRHLLRRLHSGEHQSIRSPAPSGPAVRESTVPACR